MKLRSLMAHLDEGAMGITRSLITTIDHADGVVVQSELAMGDVGEILKSVKTQVVEWEPFSRNSPILLQVIEGALLVLIGVLIVWVVERIRK